MQQRILLQCYNGIIMASLLHSNLLQNFVWHIRNETSLSKIIAFSHAVLKFIFGHANQLLLKQWYLVWHFYLMTLNKLEYSYFYWWYAIALYNSIIYQKEYATIDTMIAYLTPSPLSDEGSVMRFHCPRLSHLLMRFIILYLDTPISYFWSNDIWYGTFI